MGLSIKGVLKAFNNVGSTVKKAGKDTFNEVKRHPGLYATGASLALGASPLLGGLLGKGLGKLKRTPGIDAEGVEGGEIADPSRFRQVGSFLSNHKDDILDYGQAAEGIYDKYRAEREYSRKQPLRDAGMAGLLDTSRPDMSSIFADDMNPKGRYRSVNVGSRGAY